MRKIGEGDKSEVFVLPDGRVLKLFFSHYAHLEQVETELSRILDRAGVALPRVEENITVHGRPGIVFGNLKVGKTLSAAVRAKPWQIVPAARSLAEQHAQVHKCVSTELPSQRDRLEEEIRASDVLWEEARSIALRVLAELPDGTTVCHNDIHMLNVIVHGGDLMIIDWTLATRGNPLADVAGAVLQLRFGEQPSGFVAKVALESGRALFWRAYLRRYFELRPEGKAELERWQLPVAAALSGRRVGRMRQQLLNRIDELITIERHRPTGV